MVSGICWPFASYDGSAQFLDPVWLARLKDATAAPWLRVDCDWRNRVNGLNVDRALTAGFRVLPILQGDMAILKQEKPGSASPHLHSLLVWAIEFVSHYQFPYVEVLNEPHIMHGMEPGVYAQIVNAVGEEMRKHCPKTKVIAAAECLKPNRRGCKPHDWFARAVKGMRPDLWDIAGQHPYREPGKPDDVWRLSFRNRADELAYVTRQGGGKPVMTTEIGWNVRGLMKEHDCTIERAEQLQAMYCQRELDINERDGSRGCFLYCHQEDPNRDFGLLTKDGRPRLAATMFKEWNQMRQAA